MHILGKICAWLVVIAAGAALGLSAKLLDARGQWMDQAAKLKAANTESAKNLAKSRADLAEAQADLAREWVRWERYWNAVPATVSGEGAEATLQADVGTSQNVGSAQGNAQPVLYAFPLAADSTSSYVGPFRLTQARDNQSALRPAFQVRAGEQATWTAEKWRFRSMIPDANKARFLELESQLLLADERLRKNESNLALQTQLVETAKQHRDFRLAELLGGQNVPAGLKSQIEQAEAERDAALADVDTLRREVSARVHRLQELAAQNKELARRLAGVEIPAGGQTADAGRD